MTFLREPKTGRRDWPATAKLTSKGQLTLPTVVRERLGVGPGDYLRYEQHPDGSLVVSKADAGFEGLRGIVRVGRPVTDADVLGAVDEARAAMGRPDVERP